MNILLASLTEEEKKQSYKIIVNYLENLRNGTASNF